MRKVYIILVLCFLQFSLFANNSTNTMWDEANVFYSERDYVQASSLYEKLMLEGESAQLYYNYANTCYKLGDLGKAILNYERSLKLDPHFESAKENLNFLYSQTTDKIEPIEHFFFHEWLIMLGNQLTSNQWAILSIITFILALILLLLYLFSKIRLLRKMAFFIGIFSFLLSVSSMSYAFVIKNNNEHHPSAIIMVGSASVKSAPDNSGTELFVLHEGSKVIIKSRVGKWVEVKIADGNVGWLPAVDMSVI